MRSIDSNVILRILLDDDVEQATIARGVLSRPAFVIPTVVLEIAWVLSGRRWSRADIARGLRSMLSLNNLRLHDEAALRWAIERFETGGDFADMYHLALSSGATSFATFDQGMARYTTDSPVPVETL